MKKIVLITSMLIAALALASLPSRAQDAEEGFRALLGYKSLKLSDHEFSHNTHPDDSFLSNANVPGSAGATDVGGRLHFAEFGVGYQFHLWDNFALTLDAAGLIGGARDGRQSINDSRTPDTATQIYSEARWGTYGAASLVYYFHHFYFGAEAELTGVLIENGWNRFGDDEAQHTTFDLQPSGGPKIGYSFTRDISVEGTVQFGRYLGFGVQGIWKL
jgi:hypothetical protein